MSPNYTESFITPYLHCCSAWHCCFWPDANCFASAREPKSAANGFCEMFWLLLPWSVISLEHVLHQQVLSQTAERKVCEFAPQCYSNPAVIHLGTFYNSLFSSSWALPHPINRQPKNNMTHFKDPIIHLMSHFDTNQIIRGEQLEDESSKRQIYNSWHKVTYPHKNQHYLKKEC